MGTSLNVRNLDSFLIRAAISVVPSNGLTGRLAVDAFQRYGKGRGFPAQLNLADCLSYACAREHEVAILFKGGDFSRTHLRPAIAP